MLKPPPVNPWTIISWFPKIDPIEGGIVGCRGVYTARGLILVLYVLFYQVDIITNLAFNVMYTGNKKLVIKIIF